MPTPSPDLRSKLQELVLPVLLAVCVVGASSFLLVAPVLVVLAFLLGAGRSPWWRGGLAVLLSGGAAAVALLAGWSDLRGLLGSIAMVGLCGLFPWAIGVVWRMWRDSLESRRALTEAREFARARAEESRRITERTLLAEELHDDLGHALSLVALDLGRWEMDPRTPEPVRAGLGSSREHLAEAVARLGASVEALRGGRPASRTAGANPADLEALLEESRAAGARIVLTGAPTPETLGRYGTTTILRTVQVGLSNAHKHAPGAPVALGFEEASGMLTLEMRNPVEVDPDDDSPAGRDVMDDPGFGGFGLVALAERIRLAGGTMQTDEDEDFVLTVRLPPAGSTASASGAGGTTARPPDPVVPGGPGPTPSPRASRLPFIAKAAAVIALPVLVLVVAACSFMVLGLVETRAAVLDPTVFASIQVGDEQAEVEAALPEDRLPSSEPTPGGSAGGESCAHYAVTADPLADASGDYYRICFADGVVSSTEVVTGVAG